MNALESNTTISLPLAPASVVSDADIVVHAFHPGAVDERALLSMDPGDYKVCSPDGHGVPFATLKVLEGSLDVWEGGHKRTLKAGESTSVAKEPMKLSTREFTQATLLKRPPLRGRSRARRSVRPIDSSAPSLVVIIPPKPRCDPPWVVLESAEGS